jgi:hypothetical protein
MIVTRTRFSATAVLCGASIFVYPAIAWGQLCAPTTVNTGGATLVSEQILEQLRQRREQQSTVSMFSTAGSSVVNVSTAPTATATTTTTTAAPAPRPRTRAAVTRGAKERRFLTRSRKNRIKAGGTERYVEAAPVSRPRPRAVTTEQYVTSGYPEGGYSLKDAPIVSEAQNGVWAAVYGAYERHDNLSPGQDNNATRTQYTGGVVSGIDTYVSPTGGGYGAPLLQIGILGGYQSTRSTFNTPPVAAAQGEFNGSQVDEGGFVGVYGSYVLNQFAADLLVKLDLFDHTTNPSVTCNADQNGLIPFSGATSETNTNVASNVYYRFYADGPFWIEPTVGFRYSHTSYGDFASALFLTDGDDLRIQGGVRVGTGGVMGGYFWTASVLAGIYDDVIVNGYTLDTIPGSGSAKIDQGKVRGVGSFFGRVYDGHGMSYFAQVDVYGGQDVAGVIGKVGARWEW